MRVSVRNPRWKRGDPLAVCSRCGFTVYHSDLVTEWNGVIVCGDCYDPKHPSLDQKIMEEKLTVYNARPEPDWVPVAGIEDLEPNSSSYANDIDPF